MKIYLAQLSEEKESVFTFRQEPKGLDIDAPGINASSPVEIRAEALRIQDRLELAIGLESTVTMQCSRCLRETEFTFTKNFRLDYLLTKQDTAIDIIEDVRQELMLEYPLRPLCNQDCKGLCPKCGENLNEGDCKCV
jgi:uncharacterized protein